MWFGINTFKYWCLIFGHAGICRQPHFRVSSRQDLFWISLLIACLTTSLGTSLWNQISVSQTYNAIRHSCRRHFRFCTSLLIFWKGEQLKYSYLCHFAPFCANTSVYEILLVRFPKQSALDAVAVFRSSCIDATAEPSANNNSWVQIFVPTRQISNSKKFRL